MEKKNLGRIYMALYVIIWPLSNTFKQLLYKAVDSSIKSFLCVFLLEKNKEFNIFVFSY